MRRFILVILLVTSIAIISIVPCFASINNIEHNTAQTATNTATTNTKLDSIYTGLQAIYNLLYNNGDSITTGVLIIANRISDLSSKVDTSNYYLGRLDYNIDIIMQRIIGYFGPIAGDNKTIAEQLYDIRTNQLSIGGQVADVSSKILNTNNILTSFQSVNHSDQQAILNKLTDISNSLYYLDIQTVKDYYDFYSPTDSSSTTVLGNYPFDDTYIYRYFQPVIDVSDLDDNNSITIYYPYTGSVNNFTVSIPASFNLFTGTDLNRLRSFTFDYSVSSQIFDDSIAITYTFNGTLNSSWKYLAPHATITSDLTLSQINGFTPYFVVSSSENKFYLEVFKNQYTELINLLTAIEHNNSFVYNDDDVQINVQLNVDDGNGVTRVITKLHDLFDTGVNITSFITALNIFDNLDWFTPATNQVVNQSPGYGYLDLYD